MLKNKEILPNKYWIEEEKIVKQVKWEWEIGSSTITSKRDAKEKDLEKYYVPATKKNKVNINSIYTTIQTLMSVYYNDRSIVEFAPRKSASQIYADTLNKMAEFDYDEMWLDEIDFQWNFDRFFFWVGIKVLDWWNKVTSTPISKVISPLSWIPDPQWWFSISSHRWAWFEVEDTKDNLLKSKWYFNIDLVNDAPADKQEEIRIAYKEGRDLIDVWVQDTPNKKYSIYHHYTIVDWYKYLVTLANQKTLVIRMERIEPVLEEEKENPLLVPFPIALKYYSPIKWDPYGISVPDLLRDKQTAESKLFNLAVIKETRNSLWEDIYYDGKAIKNAKTISNPTINPKAIPVNRRDWESIQSYVWRLPKEQSTNPSFNVWSQIQLQNSLSTWLDANSLWISWTWNETATEAQITQKNANLRFILWTKIGKFWEQDFWKHWRRSYYAHLKWDDKKEIRLSENFWNSFFVFSRADFLTKEDIDVKIISSSEKESQKQKTKNDLFAIYPQYMADEKVPEVGKLQLKRKALEMIWLSKDLIWQITYNIDEDTALLDVELMNEWEEPQEPKEWQDHLTFINIYQAAVDSEIKFNAIIERKSLYSQSLEAQAEQARRIASWEWKKDNTIWNIAASNASQQQSSNLWAQQADVASLANNI